MFRKFIIHVIFFVLCLLANPVEARLGESLDQLQARFGQLKQVAVDPSLISFRLYIQEQLVKLTPFAVFKEDGYSLDTLVALDENNVCRGIWYINVGDQIKDMLSKNLEGCTSWSPLENVANDQSYENFKKFAKNPWVLLGYNPFSTSLLYWIRNDGAVAICEVYNEQSILRIFSSKCFADPKIPEKDSSILQQVKTTEMQQDALEKTRKDRY